MEMYVLTHTFEYSFSGTHQVRSTIVQLEQDKCVLKPSTTLYKTMRSPMAVKAYGKNGAAHIKTSKVTHQRRKEPNFKSSIVLCTLNGYERHEYTI